MIDRKKIDTLRSMNDDKLFRTVSFFAAANGISLSRRHGPGEAAKLRRVLDALTDGDIARINVLADAYRRGR